MKLPDLNEFIISWPESLGILKERVLTFFNNHDIPSDNVWFPDIELVLPRNLQKYQHVQVVLFGGFLDRIFESGNWPDKNYTFWCLTPKVKAVMVELLGFPETVIKIIPRYDLFPKVNQERQLDLNSDLQLVYSGRLSAQKNIEMFLAFAAILQEQTENLVSVYLLGEWDNHMPKSRGRFEIESYQKTVEIFQKKLYFKEAPLVINNLDHEQWLSLIQNNCLLVNFSTFYCEDFGVSVAQAQSLGLPMLLSRWGAHCDVEANNVSWVNGLDIAESFLPAEKIILQAQIVVNKFLSNKLASNCCEKIVLTANQSFLNLNQLQIIRSKAMKRYGDEIGLVGKNLISLFAGSDAGKLFFKAYSKIFS